MGKKSRKSKAGGGAPRGSDGVATARSTDTSAPAAAAATSPEQSQLTAQQAIYYASDGPSGVELLQTTSTSLQAKLDQLTDLGLANDRAGFVAQFVPLDVTPADVEGYLQDLTSAEEAEGQWRNLVAEVAAIRCGKGVDRIEGDQVTSAVFCFQHPLLEGCDREVGFVCTEGEWRAEG